MKKVIGLFYVKDTNEWIDGDPLTTEKVTLSGVKVRATMTIKNEVVKIITRIDGKRIQRSFPLWKLLYCIDGNFIEENDTIYLRCETLNEFLEYWVLRFASHIMKLPMQTELRIRYDEDESEFMHELITSIIL